MEKRALSWLTNSLKLIPLIPLYIFIVSNLLFSNNSLFHMYMLKFQTLVTYKVQLEDDPIVKAHLKTLYDSLLEQNLCRIIEPFSKVQVQHVAELINQPLVSWQRQIVNSHEYLSLQLSEFSRLIAADNNRLHSSQFVVFFLHLLTLGSHIFFQVDSPSFFSGSPWSCSVPSSVHMWVWSEDSLPFFIHDLTIVTRHPS